MAGVLVVPGLFLPSECEAIIARSEERGFEFASVRTSEGARTIPDIRNNSRCMMPDSDLAQRLWPKIEPLLELVPQPSAATQLSRRFRVYRYGPEQRFKPHRDGVEYIDGERSRLTLLVYLNDNFLGGETTFFERIRRDGARQTVEHRVFPSRGTAVIFEHRQLHEGSEVVSGTKYVLRTDVMFAV